MERMRPWHTSVLSHRARASLTYFQDQDTKLSVEGSGWALGKDCPPRQKAVPPFVCSYAAFLQPLCQTWTAPEHCPPMPWATDWDSWPSKDSATKLRNENWQQLWAPAQLTCLVTVVRRLMLPMPSWDGYLIVCEWDYGLRAFGWHKGNSWQRFCMLSEGGCSIGLLI